MTLWVALPLRPQASPERWSLGTLPFALVQGEGASARLLRRGTAAVPNLPQAERVALVLPAADVLLLAVDEALLKAAGAARMREALPNLLEDQLIQPAEQCHFAVGDVDPVSGRRAVAIVDRAWFRFVFEAFSSQEARSLQIFAGQTFQRIGTLRESRVRVGESSTNDTPRVLTWRSGTQSGLGVRLGADQDMPTGLWRTDAERLVQDDLDAALATGSVQGLDLCQFDFAPRGGWWSERLRPWRAALILLLAAFLLQLVALNAWWARLAWQKRELTQAMTSLVRDNVPGAPADLSPVLVMSRAISNQRAAEGANAPGDFTVLANRLATVMKGEPGDAISRLDYRDQALSVRFKPGYNAEALAKKAAGAGVTLRHAEQGSWQLMAEGR